MYGKVEEIFIHKDNMLEVINQALAIQKEHGRRQKVPFVSSLQEISYQFRTLKNGIFFSLAGTLAKAMTSL